MLIYLLAFVGGVLTILSPCILPVLPFVFARADQPFRRSGLPLLVGMALTFSLVAIAAAFGGHWVVRLNQGGRYAAMAVFLVLGLTLLFPLLAERLTRPLVRAGSRLQRGPSTESGIGKSFVLGISTGLLWAPCAGPILGLILTGAAIQGPRDRPSHRSCRCRERLQRSIAKPAKPRLTCRAMRASPGRPRTCIAGRDEIPLSRRPPRKQTTGYCPAWRTAPGKWSGNRLAWLPRPRRIPRHSAVPG